MVRSLWHGLAGLIMPHDCFVCGEVAAAAPLCGNCQAALPRWERQRACPVCAQRVANAELCGQCLRSPPAYDRVQAVFDYRFPVNRMVQALKYRQRFAMAAYFARLMAECVAPGEFDVIVPLPLHNQRLRQRGFNQAVEIARPLSRALRLPLDVDGAVRHKACPPQEGLSRRERRRNVRGVFSCRHPFAQRRILLVDDVMTTGATLDALAAALKGAGARRVEALVLARTSTLP